ncbi:hypothetical protein ACFWNR_07725 [Streptomyces virginiae]|uniref:hypothetical protein n=1 Tax=Streptomyces virginiae TaxID=1961 RepID=UPI00364F5CF8
MNEHLHNAAHQLELASNSCHYIAEAIERHSAPTQRRTGQAPAPAHASPANVSDSGAARTR